MKAKLVLILLFISMMVITKQSAAQNLQKYYIYGSCLLDKGRTSAYTEIFVIHLPGFNYRSIAVQDMEIKLKDYVYKIRHIEPSPYYDAVFGYIFDTYEEAEEHQKNLLQKAKSNNETIRHLNFFTYSWKE